MKTIIDPHIQRQLRVSLPVAVANISLLTTWRSVSVPPPGPATARQAALSKVIYGPHHSAGQSQGLYQQSIHDAPIGWIEPSLPVIRGIAVVDAIAIGSTGIFLGDLEASRPKQRSTGRTWVSDRLYIPAINGIEEQKTLASTGPAYPMTNVLARPLVSAALPCGPTTLGNELTNSRRLSSARDW